MTEIVFHAGAARQYVAWLRNNRHRVVSTVVAVDRVIVKVKTETTNDNTIFCQGFYRDQD